MKPLRTLLALSCIAITATAFAEPVGKPGAWKDTVAANGSENSVHMFTIESTGWLYQTDIQSGGWEAIGKKPLHPNVRLLTSDANFIYTVEADGSLYLTYIYGGDKQRIGVANAWKDARAIALRPEVTNPAAAMSGENDHVRSADLWTLEGAELIRAEAASYKRKAVGKPVHGDATHLVLADERVTTSYDDTKPTPEYIYTVSRDFSVQAIDMATGARKECAKPGALEGAVLVTGAMGTIYGITVKGEVIAVATKTGKSEKKAGFGKPMRFVVAVGDYLVGVDEAGSFNRINRE